MWRRWWTVAWAAMLVLAACGGNGDDGTSADTDAAPDTAAFAITSPAFVDGDPIPVDFECAGPNPALSWDGVPDGATELALVVDDPDAPGATFVHWVVWDIDPERGIAQDEVPEGSIEGTNDADRLGWIGPCPPPGDGPHRYQFTLYALSESPDLESGATAGELREAIAGSTLAETQVVGTHERG